MKRIKIILIMAATLMALFATISASVLTYAHTWPENPAEWSENDWKEWNNFWDEYWRNHKYTNPYQGWQQWQQCGQRQEEDILKKKSQPNYSNYSYTGYNYYGGVLNMYVAETESQAVILAKIIHRYGYGVASQTQQAGIAWSVLNSVDASGYGATVNTVAGNFGYNAAEATTDNFGRDLIPLARDVLWRWRAEKNGISANGRVLPTGYNYVWSDGSTAWFRTTPNESGAIWGWGYASPYGN